MIERLIEEWRACQQRVSELEREYADAMQAYYRGDGPLPPKEMHARLVNLRVEANNLLTRALREIDRRMVDEDNKSRRR